MNVLFGYDPIMAPSPQSDDPPNGGRGYHVPAVLPNGLPSGSWSAVAGVGSMPTSRPAQRASIDQRMAARRSLGLIVDSDLDPGSPATNSAPTNVESPQQARAKQFFELVNTAATGVVNLRRMLANVNTQQRPFTERDQKVYDAYNENRVAFFNLIAKFHEANPSFPKDRIQVPREIEPPESWRSWVTFVDTPTTGRTGLGAIPFIVGFVIMISAAGVALHTLNIDDWFFAEAQRVVTANDLAKQFAEGNDQAGVALQQHQQTLATGGGVLDSIKKIGVSLVWIALIGGTTYLIFKGWPTISRVTGSMLSSKS